MVTTTLPLAAPAGTTAVMLVLLHDVKAAPTPLKVTVLPPCVPPKFEPEITTDEPMGPLLGAKVLMVGGEITVNGIPALVAPATVTETLPVLAPAGSTAVILFAFHEVILATIPLNATVPVPCVAPKWEPLITTEEPTGPELGERPLTMGPVWNVVISCERGAELFPPQLAICGPEDVAVALSDSAASPEVLFESCSRLYPVPAVKTGPAELS